MFALIDCSAAKRRVLLLGAVLLLGGCGHGSDTADNALQDAASCGNIHFKSRPSVILAAYGEGGGKEVSIELVVDVPNADVESFEKLSDLPKPTPGTTEGWLERHLKDKALADQLKASSPTDFQHVLQDQNGTPYARLVVIQKTPRPDTRIYIYTGCG